MTTQSANRTVPGMNGTVPHGMSTLSTRILPVKCTEIPCRTVPYPCRGTPGGDRAGVPPPYRGHARHAHPSTPTRHPTVRHGRPRTNTPDDPTPGARP